MRNPSSDSHKQLYTTLNATYEAQSDKYAASSMNGRTALYYKQIPVDE